MPQNIKKAPNTVMREGNIAVPLRQIAYERFRECLFQGELEPGQFVSQRKLCELLDLPMGAVREAVKRLEADGLVLVLAQRGIQIRDINVSLVNDCFEFRIILECTAVKRFSERGGAALIEALAIDTRTILDQALGGVSQDLLDQALVVDRALHQLIINSFENEMVTETFRQIDDKVRLIRKNRRFTAHRVVTAMQEHLAIIDAIERNDAEAAKNAMQTHINTSWRRALGISE